MKTESSAVNHARGLALLCMHTRPRYFRALEDCAEFVKRRSSHPFGLSVPQRQAGEPLLQIHFVGAHATDMSVESFLVHVRSLIGYVDGHQVTKLRVINMPERRGQNWVFFEIWSTGRVIISGETNDFSGGGDMARHELEEVFAVLAQTYKMQIERVQLDQNIPIRTLYEEERT